ncbi:ATP-binding cassette subfamily B protein [Haloactinopolyspora alba]|uniref:ATP-binding cassette subfamily B protein n=1 Tax=Haloactinopolyspora alba TaxID=648780 RepID=A0A2P8DZ19_9ACTN|nr:ABC transporter ATP-binding protein [Haloactinopolyspora alba]PSL02462.1 ATP-binding cassette subfamily B protein [Haloactinopolyspora alba]
MPSRATSARPSPSTTTPTTTTTSATADTESPAASADPSAPGTFRRLAPYLLRHRRTLLLSIVAALFWAVAVAAVPVTQGRVVDDAIVAGTTPLLPLILLLIGVAVARFLLSGAWRYVGGKTAFRIQDDMRRDVYDTLQRLDFTGHAQLQSGQLVSRISSDLRYVHMLLSWIPQVAGSLLSALLAVVVMVTLSPIVAALVVSVIVLVFAVTNRQRRRVYAAGWDAQDREAEMTSRVEEAVTGVRVVRAFGQQPAETDRLHRSLLDMFAARVRAVRLRAPFIASLQGAPLAGQVLVLLVGGLLVMNGHLTVGAFLACTGYLAELVGVARVAGMVLTNAPLCRAATERVGELLDLEAEITEPLRPVDVPAGGGAVSFHQVRFAYADGDGHQVLRGFSLDVRPGETVALVGPSGCGKSTAMTMLPRFFDADAGTVTVDGIDVRRWSLPQLRRRIGVVFENSFLFSDTIAANIAYARPDADPEEVRRAARAAAADEFVDELPDGYDTVVGEQGITLSGGQRQRVALARALLAEPDVLLLDDATSSVDIDVEERIHANLEPFLAERTVLLVAYRESTLKLADRVVLVDDGAVADQGSHDELMARSELYRDLFGDGRGPDERPSDLMEQARTGHFEATASAWESRQDATGSLPGAQTSVPPSVAAQIEALPPPQDPSGVDLGREGGAQGRLRLPEFLRPYAGGLVVGMALVVLEAVIVLANPMLVRHAVDEGMAAESVPTLLTMCAVAAALVVALWWDQRTGFLWTARSTERLLLALRVRIFGQLQRLGIDYYDRTQAGRVMTRMTSDVDAIAQLFQVGLINAVVSLATFAGMSVVVVALDPMLALVILGVVPFAAGITWWYRRRAAVAYDEARELVSTLNADIQESMSGIRVTHAYRREAVNLSRFAALGREYVAASLRGLFATSVYVATIELLSVLAIAAVLGVGAQRVDAGTLQLGTLIAFLLYLAQVFAPIQQLSQVFDVYQRARTGLVRVRRLLALETSTPVRADATKIGRLHGDVEFSDVRLRYASASTDAIRDVDLHVPAGQRVAFVGRTGAGKSTLSKLVARFYDPSDGTVLIDGHALHDLDVTSYREHLGYVPQEPFLFSRTVRDNIAYARPEASDAEVEAAARAVGAHEFVTRLPGGYHHVVAERGRSLSAGQRQLVCLARALLGDPSILILDEATSNLDLASERKVNQAMRVASAGRTTIVVTHRPQSLHWVDRVVVVSGGRVTGDEPAPDYVARVLEPAG